MKRQLVIREGFESMVMPNWFKDLVTLGTILGNWDKSKGRLVIALACPTSRFAASAISKLGKQGQELSVKPFSLLSTNRALRARWFYRKTC